VGCVVVYGRVGTSTLGLFERMAGRPGATGDVFGVHIVRFLARLPQINGTALLEFLCVCSSGGTKVGHDIKTNPPAAPHRMVSISRRISILTLLAYCCCNWFADRLVGACLLNPNQCFLFLSSIREVQCETRY
jgi:hypothetical protein